MVFKFIICKTRVIPSFNLTLGLDYDPSTINSINARLMLSVCKLKDGITKQKTFSYDEIRSYYEKNFASKVYNILKT